MTEPKPVGAVIPEHLRERLAARGATFSAPADQEPTHTVETPEEAAERRERAAAGVRARWERRLPVLYADAGLADLHPKDVRGADWTWHADSLSLVLAGATGVGKTHAAYAFLNAQVAEGYTCEAWTVLDLLEAMRPGQEAEQAALWCRRANFLLLDDLGASKVSEWAVEQLTGLLDLRIREGKHTIVTTNLTEDQIGEAWGGRFMDRLRFKRTVKVLLGQSRRTSEF